MNKETQSNANPPKWLKELGQQSWQPEMALSGVVIFSAFKLLPIIKQIQDWIIVSLNVSELLELLLFGVSFYLEAAVCTIIVFFIGHFILRTIWVGVVGVQSVFPAGIRFNHLPFSAIFKGQAKEKMKGMEQFEQKLDDACSLLFGLTALAVLSMVLPTIPIILSAIGLELLHYVLPATIIWKVFGIGVVLMFLAAILLEVPAIKKHPKWGKWYFYFFWYSCKVSMFVFIKPYLYLYFIFTSNISPVKFGLYTGLFFTCLGFALGGSSAGSNTDMYGYVYRIFNKKEMVQSSTLDTHKVKNNYYDNLRQKGARIKNLSISSDVLFNTPYLKVFVPFLRKEQNFLTSLCTDKPQVADSLTNVFQEKQEEKSVERLDTLTQQERRVNKGWWRLNCLQKYYTMSINEQAYPNIEWSYYTHPNAEESGFVTYIPTEDLPKGKNVLTLIKHRKNKIADEVEKRYIVVPFWWSK